MAPVQHFYMALLQTFYMALVQNFYMTLVRDFLHGSSAGFFTWAYCIIKSPALDPCKKPRTRFM
jgi:hypothetical protein